MHATQDKLIQLSLYKQLIEAKFNISISWVSGGTSVAIYIKKCETHGGQPF
jgi:hypothetical protein